MLLCVHTTAIYYVYYQVFTSSLDYRTNIWEKIYEKLLSSSVTRVVFSLKGISPVTDLEAYGLVVFFHKSVVSSFNPEKKV